MSNTLIRAELEARLKTWALAQGVQVAWENVGFVKPTTPFVEPFLIPTLTLDSNVAVGRSTYRGIFQVNCWAPSGKGMRQVEALADSLIDAFPVVPKTGAVSIESTPYASRPIEDEEGWVIVPVRIKYRYENSN